MRRRKHRIPKRLRDKIEDVIRDYPFLAREIAEERERILHSLPSRDEPVGLKSGYHTSMPELQAIRLVQNRRIRSLKAKKNAVEAVYMRLEKRKKKLMRLAWWDDERPTEMEIADRLGVVTRTVVRWKAEIIEEVGRRLGWIKKPRPSERTG